MTDLLPALIAEHQPASTLERHLTHQLAHILAKQTQAEDNEIYLLAKQPSYLLTHRPDGHLVPDPAYLIYNNRLDAMRLHQGRLGREQSRTLRELHRLKRTPLAVQGASEPNVANQNRASEPTATASLVTPRLDRGVSGQGAAAAHPEPLMARSSRAMTEVAGAAEAPDEPGVIVEAPASEPKNTAFGIATEPSAASAGTANEPTASLVTLRPDRGVGGLGAAAARPHPLMARSSRAMTEVAGAAEAPDEPGMVVGAPASESTSAASCLASEPSAASSKIASEPATPPPASPRLDRGVNGHGANAAHPGPWLARSSRAKAEKAGPAESASEPKPAAHSWPVLSDAEADRIEAMIHSGDDAQLEEAARLLGIMDPGAPVPPHILALARSKLGG